MGGGIQHNVDDSGHRSAHDQHLAGDAWRAEPPAVHNGECRLESAPSTHSPLLIPDADDVVQRRAAEDLSKLLRYYMLRTRLDIEILETNELIPRTSEQARLLGVDFFSVFSRGSQFKVESIMFRLAKPENFILVSPSRKQVGGQNALECLPLVMEPQSAFYNSPVVVLDFQSLYPSVMIAYNYCYSTFLGRIVNWRGMNKMGFTEYKRQQGLLRLLGGPYQHRPERHDVRQVAGPKVAPRKDAVGDSRDQSHGEKRYEARQGRQDTAAAS